MSNNVGDLKTFILNGSQSSIPLRYVWKWWDQTVDVTQNGTIQKQLNMGGSPFDSFQLRYSVEVVAPDGQSAVYSGANTVNNPPSFVQGSIQLSQNSAAFPFVATAQVEAYDLESGAIGFSWSDGNRSLGPGSVVNVGGGTTSLGGILGFYRGTNAGTFASYRSSLNYTVTQNGSLVAAVYDLAGGTSTVTIPVFGSPPSSLRGTALTTPTSADASGPPTVRIGENIEFTVWTSPQSNATSFTWFFFGTNGWNHVGNSAGTTSSAANGALKNSVLLTSIGESAGQKTAVVTLRDNLTLQATSVKIGVELIDNEAPTFVGTVTDPAVPLAGQTIKFTVNATDPEGDLSTYRWDFSNFSPVKTLWGRTVYIDTTGLVSGTIMLGTITITDRLGATTVVTLSNIQLG